MATTIKVGIIGDYDSGMRFHTATNEALDHAARALSVDLDVQWLATQMLEDASAEKMLEPFDAFWCAPGSPYTSLHGALRAIRFARERGYPFLGT